jgi:hypothetical protein
MKIDKNLFLKKRLLKKRLINFNLKKYNNNKKVEKMIQRTILIKNKKTPKKKEILKNKNY